MTRALLLLAGFLYTAASSGFGQMNPLQIPNDVTPANPSSWGPFDHASVDTTFATNFAFRGLKLADNVLHPSAELDAGNYYLGYWGAYPLEKRHSRGYVNHHIFYGGAINPLPWSEKFSYDAGLMHYHYPSLPDHTEIFLGLTNRTTRFNTILPGAYAYYDTHSHNFTLQGQLEYKVPIEWLQSSLEISGMLGSVSVKHGDSYTYVGAGVAIPYAVSNFARVTASLNYMDSQGGGTADHLFYGLMSLTVGF